MDAENVNLSSRFPEESTQASGHNTERSLSRRAVRLPIVVRDDQEQVMRICGDVRLPQVLEIVIVGRRPTPFDLSQDASSLSDREEEIRACLCDQSALRGEHHLRAEPQVLAQERCEVILDRFARRAVHVESRKLNLRGCDVFHESLRQTIDVGQLGREFRWNGRLHVPHVPIHRPSFSAQWPPQTGFERKRPGGGHLFRHALNSEVRSRFVPVMWWSLGDSNP